MRYWVQYHNAEQHGRLPGDSEGRISKTQFIGDGDTTGAELCGIYTLKTVVQDAIRDTAFLIVGIGGPPRMHFLWSWFIIDHVEEMDDGQFNARGDDGAVLNPAPRLTGDEFDDFRRANANFSMGFRDISALPYTDRLRELCGR